MCFLNQCGLKRGRGHSVSRCRHKLDSRAGPGWLRGPSRRCSCASADRGGRGRRRATSARLVRLAGPPSQTQPWPPDHATHPRGAGAGAGGSAGAPAAGKSPPQSARRPLDNAYKPSSRKPQGHRASGTRPAALRPTLLLPRPPRLSPPPPPAAGSPGLQRPSYNNQLMGVGVGMRTAHARNTIQEGGGDCFPPIGPRG